MAYSTERNNYTKPLPLQLSYWSWFTCTLILTWLMNLFSAWQRCSCTFFMNQIGIKVTPPLRHSNLVQPMDPWAESFAICECCPGTHWHFLEWGWCLWCSCVHNIYQVLGIPNIFTDCTVLSSSWCLPRLLSFKPPWQGAIGWTWNSHVDRWDIPEHYMHKLHMVFSGKSNV